MTAPRIFAAFLAAWACASVLRQLETKLFFDGLPRGEFDVAMDFITDHADDPNLQYVHVVSEAMNNPQSYSKHSDLKIDELFQAQKRELDPAKRKFLTKDLERYSISQAYKHHALLVAAHRGPQQEDQGLEAHTEPLSG